MVIIIGILAAWKHMQYYLFGGTDYKLIVVHWKSLLQYTDSLIIGL